jgi:hypothetical protein
MIQTDDQIVEPELIHEPNSIESPQEPKADLEFVLPDVQPEEIYAMELP